ncbi:MAG: hypothetical protein ACK6CU_01305 [Deltaproteobacteria bacterium]|jgi:hypothetical protein
MSVRRNGVDLVRSGSVAVGLGLLGTGCDGTPPLMRPRDMDAALLVDAGSRLDAAGGSDAWAAVDSGSDAGSDATCGGAGIGVSGRPPEVLILFDRSCSMRRRADAPDSFAFGPDDPSSRWYVAREAVRRILTRYPTRVHWGVMPFPGVLETCGDTPSRFVRPGPGQADEVMATLDDDMVQPYRFCPPPGTSGSPPGFQARETPTNEALMATPSAIGAAPVEERLVLLITDGGATCGATEPGLAGTTIFVRSRVGRVGVIAFSAESEVGTAAGLLESIASNGGIPRPGGSPSYYRADTGGELDGLLERLIAESLPCSFSLSEVPPDPSMVRVAIDDVPLESDPVDGWTYDAPTNSLELHGAACESVRAGTTTRIGVAYGCPVPTCTPVAETCDGLDNDCDGAVDDDCLS